LGFCILNSDWRAPTEGKTRNQFEPNKAMVAKGSLAAEIHGTIRKRWQKQYRIPADDLPLSFKWSVSWTYDRAERYYDTSSEDGKSGVKLRKKWHPWSISENGAKGRALWEENLRIKGTVLRERKGRKIARLTWGDGARWPSRTEGKGLRDRKESGGHATL